VLDHRLFITALLSSTLCVGCSSEALDDDKQPPASAPSESVSLIEVYEPNARVPLSATSLAFNPTIDGELWVALRQFPSGLSCTLNEESGCAALQGAMAVVSDAVTDEPQAVIKQDGNAWHFMRRPSAMAWGDGDLFASCGETHTANYESSDSDGDGVDDGVPYTGPVLWSSSPTIFGVEPEPDQNGTHLDMLHETPFCMGIGHEAGNAYWAFNGAAGSLDRVDFHVPHQIGGEDHDDGEVHRYIAGQLLRVPEVPGHVVYDQDRDLVYVADTGHGRVLSVDPSTATPSGDIDVFEVLHDSGEMAGATVRELIAPGLLQKPSGLTLSDGRLYVTDNATSKIYVFDSAGKSERVLDTGLPAGSLAGITIGPDDKAYVSDLLTGQVHRVETAAK
jgi:outer membrane protein assembly factor BamB